MSLIDKAIATLSTIIVLGVINAEALSLAVLVVVAACGLYKFAEAIAEHGNL